MINNFIFYYFKLNRAEFNSNRKKTSNLFFVFLTQILMVSKKSHLPLEELEVLEEDYQLSSLKKQD